MVRLRISALVASIGALLFSLSPAAHSAEIPMYIGTYTKKDAAKGIYYATLDSTTGKLSELTLAVESGSPSFLVQHPTKPFIYAVNEAGGGSVTAFKIDAPGKLTEVNSQKSLGGGPTHISIDKEGKNVLVANYGGGSVAVLPIADDGSLKPVTGFEQHTGSGTDPRRQKEPHAHSIYVAADNKHAYSCDLGLDKVLVYRFNPADGSLTAADPAFASVAPGSGARHLAFAKDDAFVYCVSEMANSVTVFQKEPGMAVLKEIQTISTLPKDFTGTSSIAEVQIHPNGKFLYASNRGHESIASYSIAADGKLTSLDWTPTQGKHPRYFGLDPSGQFLVAGNMNTNTIVVFKVDAATGKLTQVGEPSACFSPVCFLFSK